MYARVNLTTGEIVATVYQLPETYIAYPVAMLADLAFAGMPGFGLFPVIPGTDPAFDPATERLADDVTPGVFDPASGTVAGSRAVLKIPAEEITARAEAAAALVDAERDRRIAAGFVYQGAAFQSRPEDFVNLGGASTAAVAAVLNGAQPGDLRWAGPADFAWIAADNRLIPLDAPGMIALGSAAMAHRSGLIFRGGAIKARIRGGEAVGDVTADALWT